MSVIVTKAELLRRIDASWKDLEQTLLSKPDEELSRSVLDGWSVKDHLAHIAAWELSLVALLRGADRRAALGLPDGDIETDEANAIVRQRYRELSPTEVRALLRGAHQEVLLALADMSDADLERPYSHYQPADEAVTNPVVGWINGNTHEHYQEHLGWLR
jgi:hypothetical protein